MNPMTVLRDALYFTQRNLGQIVMLCLPLIVLETIITQMVSSASGPDASPGYDLLVGLLVYPLYTGALILFLDARSRGESPRNSDLLARALSSGPTSPCCPPSARWPLCWGYRYWFCPVFS